MLIVHGMLFLTSTPMRLAGMGYAFKLYEPTAADTSEAMLVPTRAANLAVRWTAKLNFRNIQRLANRVFGRDDGPGP